jgi:RimJ/RimL family protein N-acetyltransferase
MSRIFGERIMLREYKKEDLEHMRKWVNNPEVTNNLSDTFLYPHTQNNTEKHLEFVLNKQGKESAYFVIAHKDTEEYIGQIDLISIDWKNRFAIMGIVIGDADNRGKGYGYESIRVLQEFVFNKLNLNKLELTVHDYNKRAINCYKKCGFKEEGRLRQRFYINGKYADHIKMGILKDEFDNM